ncbi:MAG: alpha/beta fold hydrolase [Acidimicrobiales bacterium]
MSTITLGSITVGYDDEGDGDPLVLVHGHPFNRSMWQPQVEHFGSSGWRVIVPDLRGYGETTVVPGKTPLATFAHDVVALLDHLQVERVALGGLSMGGQIVMEIHRLFPERIRGLVLADTTPQAETNHGREQRSTMADRLLREGMRPYATEVLSKMLAPYNIDAQPAIAEHVLTMMLATSPDGAAAALHGRAERPDYVSMLEEVAVPALVVVGADDEFTPISEARLMADRIPHATLAVIDGAAHMPNLEQRVAFDDVLQTFLDSLSN